MIRPCLSTHEFEEASKSLRSVGKKILVIGVIVVILVALTHDLSTNGESNLISEKPLHVHAVAKEGPAAAAAAFAVNVRSDAACPNIDPSNHRTLALRFAPWLYFDNDAKDYPMNAQHYYDFARGPNKNKYVENRDMNGIYTYYFVATCEWGQVRIVYWWYYGYQQPCILNEGKHRGDWEHIVVILKFYNDFTIDAVQYSQHGGDLTKLRSGVEMRDGRPIVYVGKIAHGSYPDQKKNPIKDITACHYFADHRSPSAQSQFNVGAHPSRLFLIDPQKPPAGQSWMADTGFCQEVNGCEVGTKPQVLGKDAATINAKYCLLKACDVTERGCEQSECVNGENRIDLDLIAPPELPDIPGVTFPKWPVRPACCGTTCVNLGVTSVCFTDPRKCSDRNWNIPQTDIPPLVPNVEAANNDGGVAVWADSSCPQPPEGRLIRCGSEAIYVIMGGQKRHLANDDIRKYLFGGAPIVVPPKWLCDATPTGASIVGDPRLAFCGTPHLLFFDGNKKSWICNHNALIAFPWRAALPREAWDSWRCGLTCNSRPICPSNPNIADTSPQCYSSAPEGSLIRCNGNDVYLVMRGQKKHITNSDILHLFFAGRPFKDIPQWLCNQTPTGASIINHPRIAVCAKNGVNYKMFYDGRTKAWFCNDAAFNRYPWKSGVHTEIWDSWRCATTCNDAPICESAVHDASPQCLSKPPPGTLFDCEGGDTKFLMAGGAKKHITNPDIYRFLFDTSKLRSVSAAFCHNAPTGASIIGDPRVVRCLGQLWFYDGRSKVVFCNNGASFSQYPFRADRIENWDDGRCNGVHTSGPCI